MTISQSIRAAALQATETLFTIILSDNDITISQTKPEFEGDYTLVLFSLVKQLKQSPDALGKTIGDYLVANFPHLFKEYNIIKGFLNLALVDTCWTDMLSQQYQNLRFGQSAPRGEKVMVEYSSPNTNKPLHLGHLRNNFLGYSIAEILKATGYEVIKTCILNDRGIHICKSMLAWQRFGNGATPHSANMKGDHLVGFYYVKFNEEYKRQAEELVQSGMPRDMAEREAPIMKSTQEMLQQWEQGDPDVRKLWSMMNSWVYTGFNETYRRIGSDFDVVYYESETYLLGKDFVEKGLREGVFFKKEDGSVWIDLTAEGLDEKLVLRSDGTSVYMTQDLGLAEQRYKDLKADQSIYVIGDEQNYHMKVLKLICKKLRMPFADGIYHLSYGMVELPTGKMKGREGTVVDADDLVDEMTATAQFHTEELGKVKDFTPDELTALYETIGLGAMKFYLLRVDPKKKMIFNPEESIDFHGFTGSFIQYSYARIKSILRKEQPDAAFEMTADGLLPLEKELCLTLEQYPTILHQAAVEFNPSVVANYAYSLSKIFNSFYAQHSIGNAESVQKKQLRLRIATMTANVIASSMKLLGIHVPERM